MFSWIGFWSVKVVSKYLNSYTLSKELFSVYTLWIRPAFWSGNMTIYLVISASTYNPVFLLATTEAFVFYLYYLRFRQIY
jgi:hypothetical protein